MHIQAHIDVNVWMRLGNKQRLLYKAVEMGYSLHQGSL